MLANFLETISFENILLKEFKSTLSFFSWKKNLINHNNRLQTSHLQTIPIFKDQSENITFGHQTIASITSAQKATNMSAPKAFGKTGKMPIWDIYGHSEQLLELLLAFEILHCFLKRSNLCEDKVATIECLGWALAATTEWRWSIHFLVLFDSKLFFVDMFYDSPPWRLRIF